MLNYGQLFFALLFALSTSAPVSPYDFPMMEKAASYWRNNIFWSIFSDLVLCLLVPGAMASIRSWVRRADPVSPSLLPAVTC